MRKKTVPRRLQTKDALLFGGWDVDGCGELEDMGCSGAAEAANVSLLDLRVVSLGLKELGLCLLCGCGGEVSKEVLLWLLLLGNL